MNRKLLSQKRLIYRIMTRVFVIIIAMSITISGSLSVKADEKVSVAYDYPITIYSLEWKGLKTVEERRIACAVPIDLLEKMTTEALVETVVKYPLFIDVYAYDSIIQGFQALSNYFGGLDVLLSRSDALECLEDYAARETTRTVSTDISFFNADLLINYLSIYHMVRSDTEKDSQTRTSCGPAIYTPNGTEVPTSWFDPYTGYYEQNRFYGLTWADHNTSQTAEEAVMYTYLAAYPSTVLVASVNPKYNCHSYGWHAQSTSNQYWICDPWVYIDDGSYSQTPSRAAGVKVVYLNTVLTCIEHSAIIVTPPTSSTPTKVISKWSHNGLFRHDIDDCPFVGINISKYYYN
ncbi:MAG: hypothetical protein IK014_09445 [Lachnospiraceae bacterium]|nr:hypothetical protein [Lachnospiraceae bacterium]